MTLSPFPYSLARRWVEEYAEFLCLSVALRTLARREIATAAIRKPMTLRAVALHAMADSLELHGLRPDEFLESPDAEVWVQMVPFASAIRWIVPPAGVTADELVADLAAMEAAWDQWEGFVKSLPEDFLLTSKLLASGGECVAELFSPRVRPAVIDG
jgi:hypothetical protein